MLTLLRSHTTLQKTTKKAPVKETVAAAAAPAVATSLASAGTVTVESPAAVAQKPSVAESGPRQAGARRSREKARGTSSRRKPSSSDGDK